MDLQFNLRTGTKSSTVFEILFFKTRLGVKAAGGPSNRLLNVITSFNRKNIKKFSFAVLHLSAMKQRNVMICVRQALINMSGSQLWKMYRNVSVAVKKIFLVRSAIRNCTNLKKWQTVGDMVFLIPETL